MKSNSKLPNVTSSVFDIMSKKALKYNALNLSQGFPNFKSDPVLIQLVEKYMRDGYNQYAPMAGSIGLREVISQKTQTLHDTLYDPNTEITITAGATQAIFTAIAATINKGDEVVIFTPAYDCYKPAIELFGGITKEIQLNPTTYKPDWEEVRAAINVKTKMIIINSPHNPSGMLFSENDMFQLQEMVVKNDLLVISDEVYEHIIYDGQTHHSAAKFEALSQRTFITASFGKTFHNTGWKMGYCIAPEYLMKEFQKVHQYNVFCVNHPIQKALTAYMQNQETYLGLSKFYQQKRDFFISLLKGSRFKVTPSMGTYFQLLDFSEISQESDIVFTDRITRDYKIATIPTSVFNKGSQDFKQIRVCFAKTEDTLKEAASILCSL